jgi:drug/metabolite transporter (DMT)-like permease
VEVSGMPYFGELSALITACFWSGSAMAFSSATQRAGVFPVNLFRLVLAVAILAAIILAFGLEVNLSRTQTVWLAVSGVTGFALGDSFLFDAFRRIGARITMLIMALAPAIAAFLAYVILGEGISTAGAAGIAVTIAGVVIVVFEPGLDGSRGSRVTAAGLVSAVLAAAGQGAGLVFAKMAFRESAVNGLVATAVRIAASLAILLPFALLTGRAAEPLRVFSRDRRALLFTLFGALCGPVFGVTFSLIAIQHTSIGIAATIMALVPILMLPLVHYFHHEKLSWHAVAGSLVAVAGVAILMMR